MSSRHPSRYDDQARRAEPRESRTARDPRETRDARESREVRETRESISHPGGRDTRETRDPRMDPRTETRIESSRVDARMDPRTDPRMDPRVDPRADPRLMPRVDPRTDPRGPFRDPRADPTGDGRLDPREVRDPRDLRDPRGESLIESRDSRFAIPRDGRDVRTARDAYERDEMDVDPPSSGRLTTYFLPSDGISREVIQADICRYLGMDATCMPSRNREGVPGYMIRAYRMLTSKMIEDLMADSKRWDEELRRSRNRGTRPAYEDTEIHERRQMTGPSQNPPGYPGQQTRIRERDDYEMEDDFRRAAPPSQRTLFPSTMTQDYPQNYPVTSGAFQNSSMTAPPEYVLARGPTEGYSQVPRSEYEMYTAAGAGRGTTLQAPNQGHFASQQGLQRPAPYQDPRTGQMIYPATSAGRGFDQASRQTGSADGRRR